MKKNIVKKSLAILEVNQLGKDQIKKIKGGTGDSANDIVIIDIITP